MEVNRTSATDASAKLNGDVSTQMHNAASAVMDHNISMKSVDNSRSRPTAVVKGVSRVGGCFC